jgi:hypothetical protein
VWSHLIDASCCSACHGCHSAAVAVPKVVAVGHGAVGFVAFTAMIPELTRPPRTTRNAHGMLCLIFMSYQLVDPRR